MSAGCSMVQLFTRKGNGWLHNGPPHVNQLPLWRLYSAAGLSLQRYLWYKKKSAVWTAEHPFPRDVEYLMCDTLELLRPKLKLSASWDEASQAADALDKEFASKLGQFLDCLHHKVFLMMIECKFKVNVLLAVLLVVWDNAVLIYLFISDQSFSFDI